MAGRVLTGGGSTTSIGANSDNLTKKDPSGVFPQTGQAFVNQLGGVSVQTTGRSVDYWDGNNANDTGLAYNISGRATVIEATVGERLAGFQDPIKAIFGTTICKDKTVLVSRKYVVGGGVTITPERAPARTVQVKEDVVTVEMQRYGGDITMNTNLFLRPGDAKAEMDMKVNAQKRELENKLVELGYNEIFDKAVRLPDACVRANPTFAGLSTAAKEGRAKQYAHMVYNRTCFGAFAKHEFPLANLLAACKTSGAYLAADGPSTVLVLPHGSSEMLRYTKKSSMDYHISGLSTSDQKPVTMAINNVTEDPSSGVKVMVHIPPVSNAKGAAMPETSESMLSENVTVYTWHKSTKNRVSFLRETQVTGGDAILTKGNVSGNIGGTMLELSQQGTSGGWSEKLNAKTAKLKKIIEKVVYGEHRQNMRGSLDVIASLRSDDTFKNHADTKLAEHAKEQLQSINGKSLKDIRTEFGTWVRNYSDSAPEGAKGLQRDPAMILRLIQTALNIMPDNKQYDEKIASLYWTLHGLATKWNAPAGATSLSDTLTGLSDTELDDVVCVMYKWAGINQTGLYDNVNADKGSPKYWYYVRKHEWEVLSENEWPTVGDDMYEDAEGKKRVLDMYKNAKLDVNGFLPTNREDQEFPPKTYQLLGDCYSYATYRGSDNGPSLTKSRWVKIIAICIAATGGILVYAFRNETPVNGLADSLQGYLIKAKAAIVNGANVTWDTATTIVKALKEFVGRMTGYMAENPMIPIFLTPLLALLGHQIHKQVTKYYDEQQQQPAGAGIGESTVLSMPHSTMAALTAGFETADASFRAAHMAGGLDSGKPAVGDVIRKVVFKMSSAILAKCGSDTGELLVGYPMTGVSTNQRTESMTIALRVYLGAVLKKPENVTIIPHVAFEGIVSEKTFTVIANPADVKTGGGEISWDEDGTILTRVVDRGSEFDTTGKCTYINRGPLGHLDDLHYIDCLNGLQVYNSPQ